MATYLGSFPPGSQPVALFSGLRVSPRGYGGFGNSDECFFGGEIAADGTEIWRTADGTRCLDYAPGAIPPDDSAFDWAGLIASLGKLAPLIDAAGRIINPKTGQQVGQLPPGWTQQQFLAAYQKKSSVPAWLLPVGIGVGVLAVGGVLFAVLRR